MFKVWIHNGRKLKDHLRHTSLPELEQCRQQLRAFKSALESTQPSWESSDLVAQELMLASMLLEFASRKGLNAISEMDESLQEERERLVTEYRTLWLARNRPGGLDESAAYLENA